uniref:PX domain-containing protein n=1 Tax=Globisporangium ultimum (strain ATCC 200006 / CBS 805.95 / DAOM BR144) TaxID=431595 RepID=K3XBQ2_GLOUD
MGCTQSTPVQEPVAVAPASNVSAAPGSSAAPAPIRSSALENSSNDAAPISASLQELVADAPASSVSAAPISSATPLLQAASAPTSTSSSAFTSSSIDIAPQSALIQESFSDPPTVNVSAPGSSGASSLQSTAAPTSNKSSASKNSAAISPPSAPGTRKLFTVTGVSIAEKGVVYYNVQAVDSNASLKKRFNDFKALYAKLANSSTLPPLPQSNLGTLFRGKHNQNFVKEREEQFEVIMNAIGNNAVFANDDAFKAFLV